MRAPCLLEANAGGQDHILTRVQRLSVVHGRRGGAAGRPRLVRPCASRLSGSVLCSCAPGCRALGLGSATLPPPVPVPARALTVRLLRNEGGPSPAPARAARIAEQAAQPFAQPRTRTRHARFHTIRREAKPGRCLFHRKVVHIAQAKRGTQARAQLGKRLL